MQPPEGGTTNRRAWRVENLSRTYSRLPLPNFVLLSTFSCHLHYSPHEHHDDSALHAPRRKRVGRRAGSDTPVVVKCGACGNCYWLDDAKQIARDTWWNSVLPPLDSEPDMEPTVDALFRRLDKWELIQDRAGRPKRAVVPTEHEYYEALEKGLATSPEQERDVRILAWWRRNDAFRNSGRPQDGRIDAASEVCRKNLEVLARLLVGEAEKVRLMRAEVLRELGEFESAKRILSQISSPDHREIVRQISSLCDSVETCVRELLPAQSQAARG
ncbi:MAG: hypothetical protein HY290_00200 [Planctomycetia bacterium]|nr:hypothetical protein [Planctomycetia bacterium]